MEHVIVALDQIAMSELEWSACYIADEIAFEQARCALDWIAANRDDEWPASLSSFVRTWRSK